MKVDHVLVVRTDVPEHLRRGVIVEQRVRRALSRIPQKRVDAPRIVDVVIGALKRACPLIFEPLLLQVVIRNDGELLVFPPALS